MIARPSRACPLVAVLVAPLAAMLPLVAWALYVVFSDVLRLPDGSPDDVPFRVVGMFMFLAPMLYVTGACFYALVFFVLGRLRSLTWRSLMLSSALIPGGLMVGVMLTPSRVGDATSVAGAFGSGAVVGVCAALGAMVQWLVVALSRKSEALVAKAR